MANEPRQGIIYDSQVTSLEANDLGRLTVEELIAPEFIGVLEQKSEELLLERRVGEAKEFVQAIDKVFDRISDSSIKRQYEDVKKLFILASFVLHPHNVQQDILRKKLINFIKRGVFIRDVILASAPNYFDDQAIDKYRREILTAVADNEEVIGGLPFAKWIGLYNEHVGKKEDRTRVDEIQFVSQSREAKSLSEKDRNLLLTALGIYDWLRFPRLADIQNISAPVPKKSPTITIPPQRPVPQPQQQTPFHKPSINPSSVSRPETTSRPAPKKMDFLKPKAPVSVSSFKKEPESPKKPAPKNQEFKKDLLKPSVTVSDVKIPNHPVKKFPTPPSVMKKPESTVSNVHSLSQAIANAGDSNEEHGNIQVGKKIPDLAKKKNIPPSPKKTEHIPPARPLTAPSPKPGRQPAVDFSKQRGVDITGISNPQELKKVSFSDLQKTGFNEGVDVLKARIQELAKNNNQPVARIAKNFFESPVYKIYVNIGTAVMQDQSGNQAAAFEKIINNYKSVGKEYLNREQFLAINRLRKELKQ